MKKKLLLLSVLALALNALAPSISVAKSLDDPRDEPDICWGDPEDENERDNCTKR